MKKILITILVTTAMMQSAVYAQKDMILPEAGNDFVYTVVTDSVPEVQPLPSEIPSADEQPTPMPELIIEPVPDQKTTTMPTPAVHPAPIATPVPGEDTIADTFTVNFTVEGQGFNKPKDITFVLYDGEKLLDESAYHIQPDEREFSVTFDVPVYNVGKKFEIVCTSGADSMRYYTDLYGVGVRVEAPTYQYIDENGERIVVIESAMNIITEKEKTVNIYVDNQLLTLKSPPTIINDIIMVPVRELSETLGVFDVRYDAVYNSVRVAVANQEILFNLDYFWSTVNGEDIVENVLPTYFGKNIYVPLNTLAGGLGSDIKITEDDKAITVTLTHSKHVTTEKVDYIISQKLTSKTDYIIWISKKNYEVNVFKNSGGIWNLEKSFPCAIGTDETPTCVGTYRYYEKIDRWNYPDFYVAPVMRFNGGYAIHSTLLKFDGTDHNRAVRKKLSHGCVRVQPPDMQWLADNIPMYTTVHVTNI